MTDDVPDTATVADAAELQRICLELALGAAHLVGGAAGRIGAVAAKSTATDLVTDVDRASERWLIDELADRRPGDGVLGEEQGERAGSTGVRWLLDPIDGTVNFVLGLPYFAVSVAAEVDGQVVAGAVANPASGELFHARRGAGAYLRSGGSETRLAGPRSVPLARAVVGTGFGYDAAVRTRQMAVAAELIARVGDIRRIGAAALDLCFVGAGRLDAYYEAGLHLWDHAAGGLVAAEAGCVASGLRNTAPGGHMYAAAAPELAADFFALLEELGADRVTG